MVKLGLEHVALIVVVAVAILALIFRLKKLAKYDRLFIEPFNEYDPDTLQALDEANEPWVASWKNACGIQAEKRDVVRLLPHWEDWKLESQEGRLCGIIGCYAPPVYRCVCGHHYCEAHKNTHICSRIFLPR